MKRIFRTQYALCFTSWAVTRTSDFRGCSEWRVCANSMVGITQNGITTFLGWSRWNSVPFAYPAYPFSQSWTSGRPVSEWRLL